MNKETILFGAIGIVMGITMICICSIWLVTGSNAINNDTLNVTNNVTKIVDENKTLEEIAIDVANNHTYNNYYAKQYNCWDFSTDLKHELIDAGFKAYNIAGLYDGSCSKNFKLSNAISHAWVIVKLNGTTIPIEATTGEILNPEKYADCYKYGYIQTDKVNSYKDEFLVK